MLFRVFGPEQHDLTGTGSGNGPVFLPQHPPCCTSGCNGFGLQQLDVPFCAGSKRGVELALDRGEGSLLPLLSVGVRVIDEVSVSAS